MMGSEAETVTSSTPSCKVLQLSSIPIPPQSPERSGLLTPPFHTSATVPFRWEQKPGKPRPSPCTAIIPLPLSLEPELELPPPPRLLNEAIIAKMPSPRVFGPPSSSFRVTAGECYGSFRRGSPENETSERMQLVRSGLRARARATSWWKRFNLKVKGKMETTTSHHITGSSSSCVFPSSLDSTDTDSEGVKQGNNTTSSCPRTKLKKQDKSHSSSSRPGTGTIPVLLATVYEGAKEAIPLPWRSRKLRKTAP